MRGRPVIVWADLAITELEGKYVLWRSDGRDYGREVKRFSTEELARSYALLYGGTRPLRHPGT